MLLPVSALSRRADLAEVIGAALAAKAAGAGHRRIAGWLSRPAETVRGWLRRFAVRAAGWRAVSTGVLTNSEMGGPQVKVKPRACFKSGKEVTDGPGAGERRPDFFIYERS